MDQTTRHIAAPVSRLDERARRRITVVGGGAAGLALVAALADQGVTARLCNRSSATIDAIIANEGIVVRRMGEPSELVGVDEVSQNIPATVEGSATVFMAVSGGAEDDLLLSMLGALADVKIIVLVSGRCGAALTCAEVLRSNSSTPPPVLAELSFPFIAASDAPGEVHIIGHKKWCPVAIEESQRTRAGIATLRSFLPSVAEVVTPVWMSLHSIPGIVFPAIMICNASRLAKGEDFAFYEEGVFANIGYLLTKLDNERMAIAEALGLTPMSAVEWFQRAYGTKGADLISVLSNTGHYSERRAPKTLQHRFLLDNIPLCVVPLAMLARRVGVAAPMLESLIEMGSALAGQDLRAAGEARAGWVQRLAYERKSSAIA